MKNCFNAIFIIFFILIFSSSADAQLLKSILGGGNSSPIPTNEQMVTNMRVDVAELSQSKYDGRKLGTNGFKNISVYLERRMQQIGLLQYGTKGYRSDYKFPAGKQRTIDTKFYIDGRSLHIGTDVLPLGFSADQDMEAHIIPNENAAYSAWTIALPATTLTKDNVQSSLKSIIVNAQTRGATAIYFYDNSSKGLVDLKKLDSKNKENIDQDITIPVWIISKSAWDENFRNKFSLLFIQSYSRYRTIFDDGYNIVGIVDNKAEKTVLISADYDCLFPQAESMGANANATGVAAVLQLATILSDKAYNKYNYAFALFSGSEMGQNGVKSFLSIPEIDKRIAYVVDLTALGNLNTQNEIDILGAASSSIFRTSIKQASVGYLPKIGEPYPYTASFEEFLKRKIPTLSISTGFEQYDAELDRIEKVNFSGLSRSVRFVVELVSKINAQDTVPVFAVQPTVLTNADLVIPKPIPVPIPAKEPKSSRLGFLASNKDKVEKVSEAKARLAASSDTTVAPVVTNSPIASKEPSVAKNNLKNSAKSQAILKLPVEQPYVGNKNVVVDFLGIGINELDEREGGALVQSVDLKGKGATLGIGTGDVILQIGSMPVSNAKTYLHNLTRYKEGERAYFKVKKATSGKTVMINVNF